MLLSFNIEINSSIENLPIEFHFLWNTFMRKITPKSLMKKIIFMIFYNFIKKKPEYSNGVNPS